MRGGESCNQAKALKIRNAAPTPSMGILQADCPQVATQHRLLQSLQTRAAARSSVPARWSIPMISGGLTKPPQSPVPVRGDKPLSVYTHILSAFLWRIQISLLIELPQGGAL